jgi:hypothetical protein
VTLAELEIFNRYSSKLLRPGENDETLEFEGGGLVVIALEVGDARFTIVETYTADNLIEVAKKVLSQPHDRPGYRFAILFRIPRQERLAGLQALGRLRGR